MTINNASDDSIINSTTMDEHDFGTENKDHLESEFQVEIIESDGHEDNLPDLQFIIKEDPKPAEEIQEANIFTTFRAINDKKRTSRNSKFDRINFSSDTDTE